MYARKCKHLSNKLLAAWRNEPIERLRVERSTGYLACSVPERNFSIFPPHDSSSNYNYRRSKKSIMSDNQESVRSLCNRPNPPFITFSMSWICINYGNGSTWCQQFITDTTSTPLVNNNLKVRLYILASSWLGIESAALKRTRPFIIDIYWQTVSHRKPQQNRRGCEDEICTRA